MSSKVQVKPPVLFWVMGGLFLLWALMGCSIYLLEKLMTDEAVLKRGGQVALDASHAYFAVICFIPVFTYPIMKEAGGSFFWVMPTIVVSLGIVEIIYSRKQRANGILR